MSEIDITSQGDATIGGDAVGRDKITHSVTQQFFGDQAAPRPCRRCSWAATKHCANCSPR